MNLKDDYDLGYEERSQKSAFITDIANNFGSISRKDFDVNGKLLIELNLSAWQLAFLHLNFTQEEFEQALFEKLGNGAYGTN
jgi:uncharacterized protein YydD (DUF2326 family)